MSTEKLFEDYCKHGLYLRGWSPKTVTIYKRAFTSYQQSLRRPEELNLPGATGAHEITKAQLEAWVMARRAAGMSPCGINIYIRAMNAFSSWLKEEKHSTEAIVLKQLKAPTKAVQVFDAKDISLILFFKPRGFYEFRTWTLLTFLLDTGVRVNEAITLKLTKVDLDNMLVSVNGKGNKERIVPISQEVRKTVFRYLQVTKKRGIQQVYLFCTERGLLLRYRNCYRDLINLCKKSGITKRVHPHLTRHTFACHFMKNGGSIYTLSRILGHSSVSTTQIYIRGLGVEDFKEEHARLSPLVRR